MAGRKDSSDLHRTVTELREAITELRREQAADRQQRAETTGRHEEPLARASHTLERLKTLVVEFVALTSLAATGANIIQHEVEPLLHPDQVQEDRNRRGEPGGETLSRPKVTPYRDRTPKELLRYLTEWHEKVNSVKLLGIEARHDDLISALFLDEVHDAVNVLAAHVETTTAPRPVPTLDISGNTEKPKF